MNDIASRVLYFAREFSGIPNSPFLYGPVLTKIMALLDEWSIPEISRTSSRSHGVFWMDEFALYVHFRRGRACRPLLIDSHLDHPGFVFNSQGNGFGFGSLGFKRIAGLLKKHGHIDLRIYNPKGEFTGLAPLTGMNGFNARLEPERRIENNSHGMWDVPDFELQNDKLLMYSADNMIVTDVMLALIEQIALSPAQFPDLDVTFVFTFLEEVFEASAAGIAMRGRMPIGRLDSNWSVIVLESMEPVALTGKERKFDGSSLKGLRLEEDADAVDFRQPGGRVSSIYKTLDLPLPGPDLGVAIKVNDMDCVYGYQFPGQPNLSEELLLAAARRVSPVFQHTVFGGACNGTAFSLYGLTGNIATLSVPNPLKHNIGKNGEIVPEEVRLSDVAAAGNIMLDVLMRSGEPVSGGGAGLARRLKETDLTPDPKTARRLKAERSAIAWGARARLKGQRYFHDNFVEFVLDRSRAAFSRIREAVEARLG